LHNDFLPGESFLNLLSVATANGEQTENIVKKISSLIFHNEEKAIAITGRMLYLPYLRHNGKLKMYVCHDR
jgi:hypothetical protein